MSKPMIARIAVAAGMATIGLLAMFTVLAGPNRSVAGAATMPSLVESEPAAVSCTSVTAIPEAECNALLRLYQFTDGANWTNNTNWLAMGSGAAPCDWYGVVCAGGHVTQLNLDRNHLTGALPPSLSNLTHLTQLLLNDNRLQGGVPKAICDLTDTVVTADFGYNALYSSKRRVRLCLSDMDPDWLDTQTIPPWDMTFTNIYTDGFDLSWTPIPYTGDGGYYEIGYATSITGTYTAHGQTADKTVGSYRIDGLEPGRTYYIQIRTVTPAHGDQPDELTSSSKRSIGVTRSLGEKILLIVYFPADNDLSPYVPSVVERLRLGATLNPNLQVVLLADGRGNHDTQILSIADGTVTPTSAVMDRWGTDELDTSDPAVLTWFLDYARTTYAASREMVSLMGHGVALAPEIDWSGAAAAGLARSTGNPIPPLPQEIDFTPSDVNSRGYLSTVDLGKALNGATNNGVDPFDLVFFDQCFQGSLDSLYEVRRAADIFVASPNYAWLVAPYGKYITQFAPTSTNQQIAESIITVYQNSLDQGHPNAIFWVKSSDVANIANAVSNLGTALQQATRQGADAKILAAALNSQFVDTTQCNRQQLDLGPPDELMGAGTFASNLQKAFPAGDNFGVNTAAANVLAALTNVHSTFQIGRPWIAPDELWVYTDTVTILAPLRRDASSSTLWRASVYTSNVPLAAQWTAVSTATVTISDTFAFALDGQWDDFLAEWYTDLTPTVGQWCQYIPPALVMGEETEIISLTVSADATNDRAALLQWEPTTDDNAVEYWVYAKGPYDVQWTVHERVPLSSTSSLQTGLVEGKTYRYRVLAMDVAGDHVAQSNAVEWAAGGWRTFLPMVKR